MDILEELHNLADPNYREFNSKIIPTHQIMLGVRIPALRKIAKRIAKQNITSDGIMDGISFVEMDKKNIYEMIMLEGLTLSYLNRPFRELLPWIEKFLDKVDNWAQVDSTICDFKHIQSDKEDVLAIVREWLFSEKEFVVRAGFVVLLAHYVEKKYLNVLFDLSQRITHKSYYVYMANSWMISTCMAKYPEETILFFKNNSLDNRTHNKAIQKSRESNRVTPENKALLKGLKRK